MSVPSGGRRPTEGRKAKKCRSCSWIGRTGSGNQAENIKSQLEAAITEQYWGRRRKWGGEKWGAVYWGTRTQSRERSRESESGLDSSDSSDRDQVYSDVDQHLLSTPIAAQVDVKKKRNNIWQHMYIEFGRKKTIAKRRVRLRKHVSPPKNTGKSDFKFVKSKNKNSIKSID